MKHYVNVAFTLKNIFKEMYASTLASSLGGLDVAWYIFWGK